MDHSVDAYLRRLSTEKLEAFLRAYSNHPQHDDEIAAVTQELSRRKEEKTEDNTAC